MKNLLIFLALSVTSVATLGQQTTDFSPVKKGTVNVKEAMKTDLEIKVENLEAPSPDGDSYKAYLQRKKLEIAAKYPEKVSPDYGSRDITSQDTLAVGKAFIGNISNPGRPNDNSMAISNDGIVMSAFNSAVFIRDTENDTTLGELSLNSFSAQIGMNFDNYDPKMIYDPENDRFIMIYLAGRTDANSHIVVCFSETKDPMGNWNIYALPGNPLNDTSWSDYPAISMTKEEAFITINLLRPGGSWQTSFKQTVIWQIDKYTGYAGDASITTKLWSGLSEGGINIRNMHPVRGGYDLKSEEMYFLSNRNFATMSDSVYLLRINSSMQSAAPSSPSIDIKLLRADKNYFLAPNARQQNGRSFATNDSRVLGGIYENGKIQYVHHGLDTNTGNVVVIHGTITNPKGNPSIQSSFIGTAGTDYGYPNIVYGGLIAGEDKSIIGFNHTGRTRNAGYSSVYFDGQNYSDIKSIKEGDTYVQISLNFLMRWGDYFGIQRKYNEECKVWMSGYYGVNNRNRTWISEVILPGDCYDTLVPPAFIENTLFPNPSETQSELHFTLDEDKELIIDLTDASGKVVRVLYQDLAKKGENRILFNTENLSSGVYFLRIYTESEKILVKKLVRK